MRSPSLIRNASALCALACLALAPAAHAQVVVNIFQNGADVDAVATGSINLSGLTPGGSNTTPPDFVQGNAAAVILGSNSGVYDLYTGFTGPASFGSGGLIDATSGSGDRFAIGGGFNQLVVPTGYTSGNPINGSAVFASQTLSSLGLTSGTYVFTLPNSTVTVLIGAAPVPEPGSIALLAGMGLSGAGFLARRRKNAPKAA